MKDNMTKRAEAMAQINYLDAQIQKANSSTQLKVKFLADTLIAKLINLNVRRDEFVAEVKRIDEILAKRLDGFDEIIGKKVK